MLCLLVVMPFTQANAQLTRGDVFLKGKYVEVGIAPNGCYGTRYNCPAGYHGRSLTTMGLTPAAAIGFVADPDKDGWTVGTRPYTGDYFLPLGPLQYWALQVGSDQYFLDRSTLEATGFPAGLSGANVSSSTIGAEQHGIWQGNTADIKIEFDTYFDTTKLYFVQRIKLKNTSTVTKYGIFYMQAVNPDNDADIATGGGPGGPGGPGSSPVSTKDTIIFQSPEKTLVIARGYISNNYLGLGSKDCRAKVFRFGEDYGIYLRDYAFALSDIFNETADADVFRYSGGLGSGNNEIGIVFKVDSLAAGDSTGLSYAYILKQEDLDSAFLQIKTNWIVNGVKYNSKDTINVCQGDAPLDALINNGDAYIWTWTPTTGLTKTTGKSNTISFGTSPVTYRAVGSSLYSACTNPDTLFLTVNPIPLPSISGTLSACAGSSSSLSGTGTPHPGIPWTSLNTGVATVSNSGVVTGVSAGTASIIYRNKYGCMDTVIFTVNPTPAISGVLSVCIGKSSLLTGSATAATTAPWTSSNPAVATVSGSGLVTSLSVGTTTITYKNSFGCTKAVTFTVNPLPVITGTLNACIGSASTLSGTETPATDTPWKSSDESVATVSKAGLVSALKVGSTLITYKNMNGCEMSATFTVNPLPVISGTFNVCAGLVSFLSGSASPDATTPWTSSNTAVATVSVSGAVRGISEGTTIISYKNSNGCVASITFTVNALPTIVGTPITCVGVASTVILTGSPTPDATTPWTSSDPAVASVSGTGTVTGISGGTATITYKNSNGCIATAGFVVNPLPTIITGISQVCVNKSITLTGSGPDSPTDPWASTNTGIATVNNAGVVTGISAGKTTIIYKNSNGCITTLLFTVNPLADPPKVISPLNLCLNVDATLLLAAGDHLKWYTSTADSTAKSVIIPPTSALGSTDYFVSETSSFGCEGPRSKLTVIVGPAPVLTIVPVRAPDFVFCDSKPVTIKAVSATAVAYEWYKSGTAIPGATADTINASDEAYFKVIVSDMYGCKTKDSVLASNNKLPFPTLSPTDVQLCDGVNIMLYCKPASTGYKYEWMKEAGPMSVDTLENKTPVSIKGTYSVVVTDIHGCVRTTNTVGVSTYPVIPKPIIIRKDPVLKLIGSYAHYQWYRNRKAIPGATKSEYRMSFDGQYYAEVSDDNGCANISDTTQVSTLSIKDMNNGQNMNISVYPNPTQDWINIAAPININVRVSDLLGHLLYEGKNVKGVSLNTFANGVYVLHISNENDELLLTEKITKTE